MSDKIVEGIINLLSELYPALPKNEYQMDDIKRLVEHFEKLGKRENDIFALSFVEHSTVKDLNSVRDQIRGDILEGKHNVYNGYGLEPKNEFEKGVIAAINLIEYRVHCICDI